MNYFKTAMLLAAMTALFMGVGFMIGGRQGVIIALMIAVAMNAWAYWNSGKAALRMHGAQEIPPNTHDQGARALYDMVAHLAREADLPTPRVFIINNDQPNAFATGRNPENAAVAATTGLINMLDRDELAGVMAHELAHIKNRDTLIMTVSATIAGAISMLAQFGMFFRGDNRNPLGFIGVLLATMLAPLAAMVIQMMISRTREYSADRMGALICGQPAALASALAKISGGASRRVLPSAERHPETAHLFIINPLSGGGGRDRLFSTHPATENRIAALNALAAEMGRPGVDFRPGERRAAPARRRGRGPWG